MSINDTSNTLTFSLPESWEKELSQELEKSYMKDLATFLSKEYERKEIILPSETEIFSAFDYTPFQSVRVVIMGQDPYHGIGQAHGLSFSVKPTVRTPPSLQNIYTELQSDLGIPPSKTGCLIQWAQQGVLLLNATLTVQKSKPMSHHNKGWEKFTDAVVETIAKKKEHVVFLLWGKNAQEKCLRFKEILQEKHLVLTAAHPSPYSAHNGFFGCKHFSKANHYLQENGMTPINWRIE